MTTKQKLILFLISSEPGIKGIRELVRIFDKSDFPADMAFNLKPLLDKNLIFVAKNFDNGTPSRYAITDEGKKYLLETFNHQEILDYVEKLDRPNLLAELTEAYLSRKYQSQ